MTNTSVTNYKLSAEIMLQVELDAWRNGEKQWNVSNQHDEYVIESALDNLDSLNDSEWEWWANSNADIMSLAHALSAYQGPELDRAWID